jgi:hypothetical protein
MRCGHRSLLHLMPWKNRFIPCTHRLPRMTRRLTYTQIHEYPLGGKPPIMTHVFGNNNNDRIIACKGSVEGVLNQSTLSEDQKRQDSKQSQNDLQLKDIGY